MKHAKFQTNYTDEGVFYKPYGQGNWDVSSLSEETISIIEVTKGDHSEVYYCSELGTTDSNQYVTIGTVSFLRTFDFEHEETVYLNPAHIVSIQMGYKHVSAVFCREESVSSKCVVSRVLRKEIEVSLSNEYKFL